VRRGYLITLFILVILGVFLAGVILYKQKFVFTFRTPYVYQPKKLYLDQAGETAISLGYNWNRLEKLVVTAQAIDNLEEQQGKLVLNLRTMAKDQSPIDFRVYFDGNSVLVLTLPDGKQQPLLRWSGTDVQEVKKLINPGDIIQVHLDVSKEEVQSLTNNSQLGPVVRLVVAN